MDKSDYFEMVLEGVNRCPEHESPYTKEDFVSVLFAWKGCSCEEAGLPACNSYCGSNGAAIGLLRDGGFVAMEEWEDSTGHGCQCAATYSVYRTLEEAIRMGLSSNGRECLGLER